VLAKNTEIILVVVGMLVAESYIKLGIKNLEEADKAKEQEELEELEELENKNLHYAIFL
jgi:hypothetical protein